MKIFSNVHKHFCLLLISLFFFLNVFSQNLYETINLADSLYNEGEYQKSLGYMKRAWFFTDTINRSYIAKRLATIFFITQNYEQAIHFYKETIRFIKNENIIEKINLQIAACHIHQKKFDDALYVLNRLCTYSNTVVKYKAICHFGNNNFGEAYRFFSIALDSISTGYEQQKQQLFMLLSSKKLKHPKIKTAQIMSAIVPGSGFLYCGNYKSVVNSFALNGALTYAFVDVALKYHPLDAIIGVFPWLFRYYRGGMIKAGECAYNKQQHHKNQILNKIIDIVE